MILRISSKYARSYWATGFRRKFPEDPGHLPVDKGPLSALGNCHNLADSIYDRQPACHIPFDHNIPVSRVPALEKQAGSIVR